MAKKSKMGETKKVICGHCGNMSYVLLPNEPAGPKPTRIKSIHLWPHALGRSVSCPYCKAVYFFHAGKWIAHIPVELEIVE